MSVCSVLMKAVDTCAETISRIDGIDVVQHSTTPRASQEGFDDLLSENVAISEDLNSIFGSERCGLVFSWHSDDRIFGSDYSRGYVRLLSPVEMVRKFHEQREIAADAKGGMLDDDEGYKSLIADWPFWLPVFSFRSGDCFCIETREPAKPMVYLEHDVMDDGPDIHGLRIARSLPELISIWADVLFVEAFDWSDVTDQDGLSVDSPPFVEIRNAIANRT